VQAWQGHHHTKLGPAQSLSLAGALSGDVILADPPVASLWTVGSIGKLSSDPALRCHPACPHARWAWAKLLAPR
jgi:hypothetical protein